MSLILLKFLNSKKNNKKQKKHKKNKKNNIFSKFVAIAAAVLADAVGVALLDDGTEVPVALGVGPVELRVVGRHLAAQARVPERLVHVLGAQIAVVSGRLDAKNDCVHIKRWRIRTICANAGQNALTRC